MTILVSSEVYIQTLLITLVNIINMKAL